MLATNYRITTQDLHIGLPETKLAIIPEFGGSMRLPGADSNSGAVFYTIK